MTQKVIFPETMYGDGSRSFQRLMDLVPAEDRADIKLKRFLVFRMKIDGEDATRAFLMNGIAHARESAFNGTLYEYLMDREAMLSGNGLDSMPPDESG
jgi:hypothetical protein